MYERNADRIDLPPNFCVFRVEAAGSLPGLRTVIDGQKMRPSCLWIKNVVM